MLILWLGRPILALEARTSWRMDSKINYPRDLAFLPKALVAFALVVSTTLLSLANTAVMAWPFSWAWNNSVAEAFRLPTIRWSEAFGFLVAIEVARWSWRGIQVSGKLRS